MSQQMNTDDLLSFYNYNNKINESQNLSSLNLKTNKNGDIVCSTPRESVNSNTQSEDDDNDKANYSCDLLRSSKIDLTNANNDDNQSNENTLDSLVESLNFNKKNLNKSILSENKNLKQHMKKMSNKESHTKRFLLQLPTTTSVSMSTNVMATSVSAPTSYYYKTPINQMQSVLNSIRKTGNTCKAHTSKRKNVQDSSLSLLNENDYSLNEGDCMDDDDSLSTTNESNTQLDAASAELEKEMLKRKHCEKQIYELNQKILSLEENIAVLTASEHKKDLFIQKMDKCLAKTLEGWKQKENDTQMIIKKLEHDKLIALANETNCIHRVKFLEDEMRQLNTELLNEKVKFQEYQRDKTAELDKVKTEFNDLQKKDLEMSKKLETFQQQITVYRDEKDSLEQTVKQLTQKSQEDKSAFDANETEYTRKINLLMHSNQQLLQQHDAMQNEYEQLIKEAKLIVDESEARHNKLADNAEAEKRAKDALLVEISILEEKFDSTVKALNIEREAKIASLENEYTDRERQLYEIHKTEINQIIEKQTKQTEELERKYRNEINTKTVDYEEKEKQFIKKIDMLQSELNSLNDNNKNLENDRNKLRQNLKQMFELQMREAMQLLGLSSTNMTTSVNEQDDKIEELKQQKHAIDAQQLDLLINKTNSNSFFENTKIPYPSYTQSQAVKDTDPNQSINGLFLKYQIDLMKNSPFSFDYQHNIPTPKPTIQPLATKLEPEIKLNAFPTATAIVENQMSSSNSSSVKSSSSTSVDTSINQIKQFDDLNKFKLNFQKKDDEELCSIDASSQKTSLQAPNSARTSELRHFIEKLLDKAPKVEEINDKNKSPNAKLNIVKSSFSVETGLSELTVTSEYVPIVNVDKLGFKPIRSSTTTNLIDDIGVDLNENDYYFEFNRNLNKDFNDFKRSLNVDENNYSSSNRKLSESESDDNYNCIDHGKKKSKSPTHNLKDKPKVTKRVWK